MVVACGNHVVIHLRESIWCANCSIWGMVLSGGLVGSGSHVLYWAARMADMRVCFVW